MVQMDPSTADMTSTVPTNRVCAGRRNTSVPVAVHYEVLYDSNIASLRARARRQVFLVESDCVVCSILIVDCMGY
jgi:hypothetical protein